jgi:DNA primase
MFPIRDSSGDVVGFGARLIEDSNLDKQLEVKHEAFSKETEPKYLNSKETTLFQKGHLLYGYHLARKNITKESGFILVEGYMDVIRLHQEGFSTAVAPLGTAVTEHQLRLLWKSQKSPIICLDADQAGINATMKVLERALPYINSNQTLFFCLLHEAKDPDSFISFFGKNRFQDKLSQARSFVDMFWKFCLKKANLETNLISDFCLTLENFEKSPSPERRAFLSDTVKNYVHQIKDQTLQVFYLKEFQKRENELWDAVDFKFSLKNKSNQRERRIIKTNCLQETSKENIKIQPISFSPEYQKINVNINCQINLESIIDQDWQSKILLAIVLLNPILIEYTQEEVSLLKFFDMSWKQAKDVVLAVSSNFDAMESNLLLRNIITQIENADCLMQEACDLVDLHIPFLRKKRDSNTRDDFKKDCSEVDFRNEKDLLAIWKKMFETFVVRSSLKREIEDLSCVVKKTQDAQSWKRLCLLKKAALQRISQADVV